MDSGESGTPTVSILLVDDQGQTARNLRHALDGHDVVWIPHPHEAVEWLQTRAPHQLPDAVFVDHDFRDPEGPAFGQPTGFTVFLALRELRPRPRSIVFTTLQGGALYAVAARRWLGASAVLDKSATDSQLRAIITSREVSLYPGWRARLATHSHLLDGLFPTRHSGLIWSVWQEAQGDTGTIARLAHLGQSTVKQFASLVHDDVANVQEHLLGHARVGTQRGNKNLRGPILELASSQSQFFRAPELPEILEIAQPWVRRPWKV